jgi:hypothetical protein
LGGCYTALVAVERHLPLQPALYTAALSRAQQYALWARQR